MEYEKNCRLPACILNDLFIQQLWAIFCQEANFSWQASIVSGGELLPKNVNEMTKLMQTIDDQAELLRILKSVKRIDQLTLTVEIKEKGFIVIVFKNVNQASGFLLVSGNNEDWVAKTCERIQDLFMNFTNGFVTRLFGTIGYGIIHSVIPLVLSSLIVIAVLGLLIPSAYRHSELIWWISAISILITLRLAYSISNYLLICTLQKYPYIRWGK